MHGHTHIIIKLTQTELISLTYVINVFLHLIDVSTYESPLARSPFVLANLCESMAARRTRVIGLYLASID